MTIYLNLGSNLGDTTCHLCRAILGLAHAFAGCIVRATYPVFSEPWGFVSEHAFVNRGVAISSPVDIDPYEVLRRCQQVEKSISSASHRDQHGNYIDRVIDIDIIDIPGITMSTPTLTLPHPRMRQRLFVMIPLQELKKATFV